MIGAYPIGTFPYGSIIQETGIAIISLPVAEASVQANDLSVAVAFPLQVAQLQVQANDLNPVYVLTHDVAQATVSALDFDKVTIGQSLEAGQLQVTANDVFTKTLLNLGFAELSTDANDLITLTKLLSQVGELDLTANDLGQNIGVNMGRAELALSAVDFADIVYVVDDVPQIQVDRTSTQAVVKVTNPSDIKNVRIFRADDHRGTFSTLVSNHDESSDYTDSGLDASKNFKYKCAFIIVGTKGGVEYIAVGERSAPVYTIGTNVL